MRFQYAAQGRNLNNSELGFVLFTANTLETQRRHRIRAPRPSETNTYANRVGIAGANGII